MGTSAKHVCRCKFLALRVLQLQINLVRFMVFLKPVGRSYRNVSYLPSSGLHWTMLFPVSRVS